MLLILKTTSRYIQNFRLYHSIRLKYIWFCLKVKSQYPGRIVLHIMYTADVLYTYYICTELKSLRNQRPSPVYGWQRGMVPNPQRILNNKGPLVGSTFPIVDILILFGSGQKIIFSILVDD